MSDVLIQAKALRRIIVICGAKRAGKDTVADILCQLPQFNFTKHRIADPLKHVCKYLFEFNNEQIEGDLKEVVDDRMGVTPRFMLQYFGTELMQLQLQQHVPKVGRSIWMNKLLANIKDDRGDVVISDLRFCHEFLALKNAYPNTCKLMRINNIIADSNAMSDGHVSEHEWKQLKPDMIVGNNGSIDELKSLVLAECIKIES